MNKSESDQLVHDIISKAVEGQAMPFRPIKHWTEFRYYVGVRRSTKLIIGTLRNSADKLFKEYCNNVVDGTSDVTKLLAYSQILDVKAFYENELITIKKMLDDYDEYLGDWGNFFNAIFGGEREL